MDTIAPATPALPTELRHRRVRLAMGPAAAAYACGHVRTAIAGWSVPVNPAVAILLTSDLVINAALNGADDHIVLGIRWSAGGLRVEVHDASGNSGARQNADAGPDEERGLLLAASLAARWGHYKTPAGRVVFYELAFESAPSAVTGAGHAPGVAASGNGEP